MYVVIDGTLSGSVARNGGRIELEEMSRGSVLGEVAIFSSQHRRTADIDTETDCRLLRLTWEDLERLRSRYPRVAAQVFWNLNQIQAARLARTTERLR
jgi:CRP-like cAMP-binding protein